METLNNQIETLLDNSQYEESALLVAEKLGFEIEVEFLKNDFHFQGDKDKRDIYKCTIKRGNRKYSFNFGQSLNNSGFYYTKGVQKTELNRKYLEKDYFKGKSFGLNWEIKRNDRDFISQSDKIHYPKEPTYYDIIACLQKYDVGAFEEFCSEFGYDTDSRTAEKTYTSVIKEFNGMQSLFNDEELEILSLIA